MARSIHVATDVRKVIENYNSQVRAVFRGRAVSFSTMSPRLRHVSLGVILLVVASGILLAVPAIPALMLNLGTLGDLGTLSALGHWSTLGDLSTFGALVSAPIQVSLVIYLYTLATFAIGWTLVLMAARGLPAGPRLLLIVPTIGLLGSAAVSRLLTSSGQGGPSVAEFWLRLLQVAALGALAAAAIAGAIQGRQRAAEVEQRRPGRVQQWALWSAAIFVACYYLAELSITLSYMAVPSDGKQSGQLAGAIAAQTRFLPWILVVVVYWGSTDFIEWGQMAARGVTQVTRQLRSPALFYSFVAILAAAFLVDLIHLFGIFDYLLGVVTSLITIAFVALLARFARVDATWPVRVPIAVLLVGIAFLFGFFQLATTGVAFLAPRVPPAQLNPLYTIITVSASLGLLATGLVVIARGRERDHSGLRAAGLFLALMGLLFIALSVPQLANVIGLPVVAKSQLSVPSLKFIILPATLLALAWLALRRRLTDALVAPFAVTLSLIMGLQVIAWFFFPLLDALSAISSVSVVVATLFFLAAIIWDFVMSGESVTNRSSAKVPRNTRVMLYLGYTLLGTATLVYLKSVRITATGQIVPLGSESTVFQYYGAIGLGLPLIAYAFIQGMARHRSGAAAEPAGEPRSHGGRAASSPSPRDPRGPAQKANKARSVNTIIRLFSSSSLLLALVTLAACSNTETAGQTGADPSPTSATAPAVPTATRPRPTATPTIAVIDSGTIAAWSNPLFNQPSAKSFQATSVSNGVGTYSIPVNVTFVPTPFQNDSRFKPPVINLVFEYTDPIKGTDVQVPLVSNQTKVVTFSATCPANGGAGGVDSTASVFVQNTKGIVWQNLNATNPTNVRNTFLHIDLTCP